MRQFLFLWIQARHVMTLYGEIFATTENFTFRVMGRLPLEVLHEPVTP